MAVIALGNERGPDGVKKSRAETAGSFIEVARILVKHGLGEGMADQDVGDAGGVVRAKALAVPFHPLAELAVGGVAPLLDSGAGCVAQDGLRIDEGSQPKVKFLGGGQRRGIGIVGDVEVRKNPEQSLFLLGVHLLDGQFVRRQTHIHFADGGCDLQNDRRERWILPGNHGNIGLLDP